MLSSIRQQQQRSGVQGGPPKSATHSCSSRCLAPAFSACLSRPVLVIPIPAENRVVAIDAETGPTGQGPTALQRPGTFEMALKYSPRSVATDTYGHLYAVGVGNSERHFQKWNRTEISMVFHPQTLP
eukprot:m.309786 g.309786  ORF g.309786 m.309786 type:complete len:127 (-) comp27429_c0_seq11:286-666(-)